MPAIFSHEWNTEVYKGKTSFNTGLFINGQYVDGRKGTTIERVVLFKLFSDHISYHSFFSVVNPSSPTFDLHAVADTDFFL